MNRRTDLRVRPPRCTGAIEPVSLALTLSEIAWEHDIMPLLIHGRAWRSVLRQKHAMFGLLIL
jgi:hypothetical protein